ncbi:MAG: membrane protein insertase YidC [Solobacterium sp.]|jgi:YidC/Oxa1 family membrane protein insertase|nr:membrane protein insertase YidC [Solobacterium sp.]MCH4048993.1 membrane protein insertase YidC [Solobacterium sp.]MCH4074253.1 membrane protein insertase YidC [Solobacterium sp.]MCI1313550.1 membrane protein insertase YidC [Solobacterium sp.]MCI1345742.1 membrane protein insertase YidC [Solobacterium sp.]
MKLSRRTKKILAAAVLITSAAMMAGCTVPRDSSGNIILIERATSFSDIFHSENWFSAIFVWPLAQFINILAPKIGVGGAIALITILINGILAIVTLKSTISTQEMQLIQPEVARIQRKYEGRDDRNSQMKMAAEMQKLYAEHDIHPMGTMVVTFIQLPILMAMYMAVERSYAVFHGTFLGVNLQTTPWKGMTGGHWMYLVIFLIMTLCQTLSMFVPQWLSKQRAKREAEKHHRKPEEGNDRQQKIMQIYMLVMVVIFGLTLPSAMAVYWTFNSLVNVVKTLLVQKYIDKKQAEKEGAR